MKKKSGFTLIEILVVMAIIGVLSAILFPHFTKILDRGRQLACFTNEMQLGFAVTQYVQDSDGAYPPGSNENFYNTNHYGPGWAGEIHPYLKNETVFKCPSDERKVEISKTGRAISPISYAYNLNLAEPAPLQPSAKISEMTSTGHTVLFCECYGASAVVTDPQEAASPVATGVVSAGIKAYATGELGGRSNSQAGYDTGFFPFGKVRHGEGSNFVMADGHVKWLRGVQVSSGMPAAKSTDDETTGGSPDGYSTAAGAEFTNKSAVTGQPFTATFSWK